MSVPAGCWSLRTMSLAETVAAAGNPFRISLLLVLGLIRMDRDGERDGAFAAGDVPKLQSTLDGVSAELGLGVVLLGLAALELEARVGKLVVHELAHPVEVAGDEALDDGRSRLRPGAVDHRPLREREALGEAVGRRDRRAGARARRELAARVARLAAARSDREHGEERGRSEDRPRSESARETRRAQRTVPPLSVTVFEALLLPSFDSAIPFAGSAATVTVWSPFWPFVLHWVEAWPTEPAAIEGTVGWASCTPSTENRTGTEEAAASPVLCTVARIVTSLPLLVSCWTTAMSPAVIARSGCGTRQSLTV